MELIDKIKAILKNNTGLKAPVIDIHLDNQNNIIGYVADEVFENKEDKESQEIIWNALKKRLEAEELIQVFGIFHETPRERAARLTGQHPRAVWNSNFWIHSTPDSRKYWMFIGVGNFKEQGYKSFYLIINQKDDFKTGSTFVYSKEILAFMELESSEIYDELYTNTFEYAENEIKIHLMNKYERLAEKGTWGNANIFRYVFTDFELRPVTKKQLIFNEGEVNMIQAALVELDNFDVKKDIFEAVANSKIFNGHIRKIA